MYKFKNVPLTISEILKEGWELYKPSIKPVLFWSFIIAIIHIIPFYLGYIGFYEIKANGGLSFSWTAVLVIGLLLFVESFFTTALFYPIYLIATGQKVTFKSVLDTARSLIFPIYFALLLYFLAVNIGVFLLILPAVFIGILFSMILPFIICERQSVIPAFRSSAKLVWGHWWQTFFALVIPYGGSYLIRNFARFTPWADHRWLLLGDALLLTFFMPYFYTVLLVQYHNLKYIKSLPSAISDRHRLQS